MLREQSHFFTKLHLMLDICWVVFAFIMAYYLKKHIIPLPWGGLDTRPNYYLVLLAAIFVVFLVFNSFSIHDSNRTKNFHEIILTNLQVVFVSLLLLLVFLYLLHVPQISRLFFVIFGLLLFVCLSLSKIFIYKTLRYYRTREYNTRNVLIVGTHSMARDVIQTINQNPESGYRIIGCLEPSEFPLDFNKNIQENVQMIGSAVHYKYHLLENTVDELVIATYPLTDLINIGDMIHFAEELGISVRIVPDLQLQQILFKPETARLQLKQFLGLPTISLTSTPESEMALVFKSFFDYLLALVGVVLLSPFFLLIAALIKTTSPGPIFYRQERCGLFARRFNVIKFRTMVNNAHSLRQNLNEINEMDGPVFKIKNDPRITLIGKFLRKTSFDELPQLFNVLMGHMSLVGPRPAIPEEVELYKPWQRRRLSMKPGLTCIWQVSGRNNIDFEQWMRMDLQYIDSWSIWLDFWILLKTVREVFLLHGR